MKSRLACVILLFPLLTLTWSFNATAQLSASDLQLLYGQVLEELSKSRSLKFLRVTSEGELATCALNFSGAYRDFNAMKGAPVYYEGSFSQHYFKGKNLSYSLKLVTSVLRIETQKWELTTPQYLNLFLRNKGIERYRVADFACETAGRCLAFADTDFSLTPLVLDHLPNEAVVKFSLIKGGLDNIIDLATLASARELAKSKIEFMTCSQEIFEKTLRDLGVSNRK